MVGGLQIFLAGGEIVAFHVGLFTIHEIQVGHGVVVVGAELNRLVQTVDAFLDRRRILRLQFITNFFLIFVLGVQVLVRLQSELGALFHARLVASRPVNDADGVVRLGIV